MNILKINLAFFNFFYIFPVLNSSQEIPILIIDFIRHGVRAPKYQIYEKFNYIGTEIEGLTQEGFLEMFMKGLQT